MATCKNSQCLKRVNKRPPPASFWSQRLSDWLC